MTIPPIHVRRGLHDSISRRVWGVRTCPVVLTGPLCLLEISDFLLSLEFQGHYLLCRIPHSCFLSAPLLPVFHPHWFQVGLESALKYVFLICCVLYFSLMETNLICNQLSHFQLFMKILFFRIIWHFECVILAKRWRKC